MKAVFVLAVAVLLVCFAPERNMADLGSVPVTLPADTNFLNVFAVIMKLAIDAFYGGVCILANVFDAVFTGVGAFTAPVKAVVNCNANTTTRAISALITSTCGNTNTLLVTIVSASPLPIPL